MPERIHGFTDAGWEQHKRFVQREIRRARSVQQQSGRWHKKGSSVGAGNRIGFEVVTVEGNPDIRGGPIEATGNSGIPIMLVGRWVWHTRQTQPKDSYEYGFQDVVDVFDISCVLKPPDIDALMSVLAYGELTVYGEATYGYFKASDVGFWKLDHPLCYLEGSVGSGSEPVFIISPCCGPDPVPFADRWKFTGGWGSGLDLDQQRNWLGGAPTFDYLGQSFEIPPRFGAATYRYTFIGQSGNQQTIPTQPLDENYNGGQITVTGEPFAISLPYEYPNGLLPPLRGVVTFEYNVGCAFPMNPTVTGGCGMTASDDLLITHYNADGVQVLASVRQHYGGSTTLGGPLTTTGPYACGGDVQTAPDVPFNPGLYPRTIEAA